MKLSTLFNLFNASCDRDAEITGFSIDTRTVLPGNVFIAIKGEQFNGHDFIVEAEKKGAIAAVVCELNTSLAMPQLLVSDTINALAKIASAHRSTIASPVIALTGSNGKTTVKEMIAAILPAPSLSTKGNFNNHIGAPLSVLQLNEQHRFAVFELGANHVGEIAYTAAIVRPDIALINNIAPAHIGEFGSIDNVAKTKGEIYHALSDAGIAIVNEDDIYAHSWDAYLKDKQVIRFSLKKKTDIYATNIVLDDKGFARFNLVLPNTTFPIALNVPGFHNVSNALAAACCCLAAGITPDAIKKGLLAFGGVKGRLQVRHSKQYATIIDDTYNANLRSVLAALDVLAAYPGKRLFVFGDMGELGDYAIAHHDEIGLAAKALHIDKLFTVGTISQHTTQAFGSGAQHFSDKDSLIKTLLPLLDETTTVLVKGSRGAQMELVVEGII